MQQGDIVSLLFLLLLILFSAFFSSAETALTVVSKIRIRSLAEEGNARAKMILSVKEQTDKMLSAILICNNIVNLSASSLATSFTIRLFGNVYVGWATGILTFLVLIFGEVGPKTIATLRAEQLSLAYIRIIRFLMIVLTPLIFFVNICAKFVLRPFHLDVGSNQDTITEDELRTVLDVSQEQGVIEKDEHEMFHNVIDFGDTKAKDVMVPPIHIVSASIDSTYDELLDIYKENRFTRLPIYEESADEIVGIINIKDLLLKEKVPGFTARDILQEPYFTYENKSTSELLLEMRRDHPTMAIVLDEYGELSGLLTIEDLLEEIVGEFNSEEEGRIENEDIVCISDGAYRVEASMNLDDFCEELELSLHSDDYDSVGGFVIEHLDRIPAAGDTITTEDGIRFIVESMDEKRIDKLLVYIPISLNPKKDAPQESEDR